MNTKILRTLAPAVSLLACLGAVRAADVRVDLTSSGENPAAPTMGDWMYFRSVIRNVEFHIARKPVVESRRILPAALGVPLFIAGLLGYNGFRRHRRRVGAQQPRQ